jgi:hypothetical protein
VNPSGKTDECIVLPRLGVVYAGDRYIVGRPALVFVSTRATVVFRIPIGSLTPTLVVMSSPHRFFPSFRPIVNKQIP